METILAAIVGGFLAAGTGWRHASAGHGSGNSRNGTRRKTVKGDQGELPLDIPRDRRGDYEPQLIPNGQSRIPGFDDKIISLYARGMATREIQAHLEELYGVGISPALISNITAVVLDEVKAWQSRPLDAVYIETVYPQADVQPCIVHMVRNSLKYVSWKQRKAVANDLKAIYKAATIEEAELALEVFAQTWDAQYPTIRKSWRQQWEQLSGFFIYPDAIRKVINTTNAIESLNRSLRQIIKTRRVFPNDEAATKLIYLAVQNAGDCPYVS